MGERDGWGIKALYAVAIAINVVFVWERIKDRPDVQLKVAQLRARWDRFTQGCEGCKKRREAVNHMLWQAQQIVTGERSGD